MVRVDSWIALLSGGEIQSTKPHEIKTKTPCQKDKKLEVCYIKGCMEEFGLFRQPPVLGQEYLCEDLTE